MAKRFLTYFDTPIPPKRNKKYGAGTTTIRFVLKGKIPSKKNNQQAVAVRKPARDWANKQAKLRQPTWADVHKAISMCSAKMRGNAKYIEFLQKVKPVLESQRQEWLNRLVDKGLTFPLPKSTLTLSLYWKDRYRRDSANALQTIQDALVDSNILADDNYELLNPISIDSDCFYEEIIENIAFISLTFRL